MANVKNWSIVKRAGKAFYGWRILGAGGIAGALGSGLCMYGFSVFFLPISTTLGLNRAATSLVFSLSRAEGSVEGPIAGILIDRLGPRKVLFAAATMMGLGYILLSRVDSFLTFLLVYMGVISFGFNAGLMHVPVATVNSWFVRKRGLALGIVMACFGLGGAFVPPALSLGIKHFDWRTTAFISGLVVLSVVLPISLVFRRSPESMGLLPDGDKVKANEESAQKSPQGQVDFSVGEALRTRSFWLLTIVTCLRIAGHMGFIVHFVPIMVWRGADETTGALLLGFLALFSVPLRVLIGWAGDRISKARVLAIGCGAGAIAIFLMTYAQPGWQLWVFVALLATGDAAGPMSWALVGDYFGRKRYATIRGAMTAFTGIAAAVMPVAAGMLFDATQSYELTLWISAALLVLASVIFAIMRPPSRQTR